MTATDPPHFETLLPRPLSPRQARLLERARAHAADFETRADAHDREGTYPSENMEAMKASGYAHMILPEAWGGEDVSLLELCACQEQLGQGCAGTAIAIPNPSPNPGLTGCIPPSLRDIPHNDLDDLPLPDCPP